MSARPLFVDGRLVPAASGKTFDNVDPATEKVLGSTADAGPEDMLQAISAARVAFDTGPWSQDPALRARCLLQLQDILTEQVEQIRSTVVAESGTPVQLTEALQVDRPISDLSYWAQMAESYPYEEWLEEKEIFGVRSRRLVRKEAIGVVGAITPWNYPLFLNIAKLGPALAAGCTVVLKPAPDTPWSATLLGEAVAARTDFPAGVVNIVTSSDHLVGQILADSADVDMITFTGSTATGRRLMERGAPTIKKVFLELGGKSASVLLDDADFEEIVPIVAGGVCMHAGQGCAVPTRLLLPASRYDEGVEIAAETMRQVPFGDPTDPDNLMGPLISALQRTRVLGHIERGQTQARLVLGGGTPGNLHSGFYVNPTLFADVPADSDLAQQEIFGPVLVIQRFGDDDDAAALANNSAYGLSGEVFSADQERALRIAKRIRTGTLSVNGGQWFDVSTPFGGYKQSGLGREGGQAGLEEYLETKVIGVPA